MFERLRDALDAVLDAASSSEEQGGRAEEMHQATIEMKTAVTHLQEALRETESRLADERRRLADAARRGGLAKNIADDETAAIADEYAEKHRGWIAVLEKKQDAQRHELSLIEGELSEMRARAKEAAQSRPADDGAEAIDRAWAEIERLGGTRPETDVRDDYLKATMDRAAKERQAEAQLEELKRRMGR